MNIKEEQRWIDFDDLVLLPITQKGVWELSVTIKQWAQIFEWADKFGLYSDDY